jgi:uncharacterized protein (DUF305 family)
MRKRWLVFGVPVLAFMAAAVPSAFADSPAPGRLGRAEVRFMEGMIDHHQMALDMAHDCLNKAKTESVRTLCQNILTAQTAEIKTLHDWLLAWYKVDYQPVSMMSMGHSSMAATPDSGMHMGGTMEAGSSMGMAHDPSGMMGMMAGLNRLEGRDYEIAFLESMIDHHDDAVHMSERILKVAEHKELRKMAQKIIGDQTAEIKAMEDLLRDYAKQ